MWMFYFTHFTPKKMAPDAKRCRMVSQINWTKGMHDGWLWNILAGEIFGNVESVDDPIQKFNAYSTIDAQLPKKVPKQKNLLNTEKMGDQWLSSIKFYYSKKMWNFMWNYNKKWLASSESLQFKQFFYISNCFRVIRCQKRVFDLVPSPYRDILVQFSH
jgi:hypothetical protein